MPRTLSRRAFFLGRGAVPGTTAPSVGGAGPDSARRVAELAANCLAVNGVACGTCADPCEPRALRLRPLLGGRALPVIDVETCTGCGDCAAICPVGALAVVTAPAASEDAACA